MITFKKYIPGFAINGPIEPEIIKYESQIDMLKDQNSKNVYRFSIDKNKITKSLTLMVEYDEGKTWYVLGFILDHGKNEIDLPKWVPKY